MLIYRHPRKDLLELIALQLRRVGSMILLILPWVKVLNILKDDDDLVTLFKNSDCTIHDIFSDKYKSAVNDNGVYKNGVPELKEHHSNIYTLPNH